MNEEELLGYKSLLDNFASVHLPKHMTFSEFIRRVNGVMGNSGLPPDDNDPCRSQKIIVYRTFLIEQRRCHKRKTDRCTI